jgi:hypothetical protein
MKACLEAPFCQGVILILLGMLVAAGVLIPGFSMDFKLVCGTTAVALLSAGGTKLGIIGTQKKLDASLGNQERMERKIDQNTSITAEAADAAKVAVVHAETAAENAATAAQETVAARELVAEKLQATEEAAQARRMP